MRLDGVELGSIYAINALTQFLFMNTVMKRVRSDANTHMLIQVGVLLSSAVFLTYYSSTTYIHTYISYPAQILLGISWIMLYLGSLYTQQE